MSICCEIDMVGPMRRVTLSSAGQEINSELGGFWLSLPDEVEDALDAVTRPYGISGFEWMCQIGDVIGRTGESPWAMIALDREYELVGHLMRGKGTTRDLRFMWYSISREQAIPSSPSKMSFLLAMNKQVLAVLANHSPLFSLMWISLKDKPENRKWFCLLDTLPAEWVRDAEACDAAVRFELNRTNVSARPVP